MMLIDFTLAVRICIFVSCLRSLKDAVEELGSEMRFPVSVQYFNQKAMFYVTVYDKKTKKPY